MNKNNIIFFEEYKKLDKLCSEIYQEQYGITHYIDDMKNKPEKDSCHIPGWKTDLKQLIRIRHIRNYLAHEGAFEEELCTQNDIDWIKTFYQRILTQSDPCTMLYQNTLIKKNPNNDLRIEKQKPKRKTHTYQKKKNKTMDKLYLTLVTIFLYVVVIIIVGCFIYILLSDKLL